MVKAAAVLVVWWQPLCCQHAGAMCLHQYKQILLDEWRWQ